jgi:hypothetical protein
MTTFSCAASAETNNVPPVNPLVPDQLVAHPRLLRRARAVSFLHLDRSSQLRLNLSGHGRFYYF